MRASRCTVTYLNRSARRRAIGPAARRAIAAVVDAACAEQPRHAAGPCSLTVLLVDGAESAALHRQHFADPTATDVMTFPDGAIDPASGRRHLGDLAVCVTVAADEAGRRKRPLGHELALYTLHGLLHLLGYDDRTTAKRRRMWAAQRRLLATVGIVIEAEAG